MLKYVSLGKGDEKVIVLHGWMMDHTCFDGMLTSLDQKKFTYVFIDQQGYGLSKDMPGPYNVAQVARDVIEVTDHLKWTKFHIVAHSMGGKVISRLLADIPDRLKCAVGINPCPPVKIPFDEQGWTFFSKAAEDVATRKEIFRADTADHLTETWYEMIAQKSMQSSTPQAVADYLDSWVNYEFPQDIQGCTVPIKILASEYDPHLTCDVMNGTYGQWCRNVEIKELNNCGHYPMYEIPLSLAKECESFLSKNSSNS